MFLNLLVRRMMLYAGIFCLAFFVASFSDVSSSSIFADAETPESQIQQTIPSETLFPNTTKGFFAICNVKTFVDRWNKTQIGELMNTPMMADFKEDIRIQLSERMESQFGFTLDEINEIPEGEVAAGMIAVPGEIPGYVFLLDVKSVHSETDDYLDRLSKKLKTSGVVRTIEQYKENEVITFTFPSLSSEKAAPGATTAPTQKSTPTRSTPSSRIQTRPTSDKNAGDKNPGDKNAGDKNAAKTTPKTTEKVESTPAPNKRQVHYLLTDNFLIVSDQLHLIHLMLDRVQMADDNDRIATSLAALDDFEKTMARCYADLPENTPPLIRWYIEPLNYGESIRVLLQGMAAEKRRNKPSIFSILKEQGFDAIRGVGGVIGIKEEEKEVIYRVFIHTQKPYRLAMQMLNFPDSTNFALENWMPADLARCTIVFVDPIKIFDNFGSLFDALVMPGDPPGTWDDIVEGLEKDPYGPQINLRSELINHLGHRVLGMSKYQLPITTNSECIVIAVEIKEGMDSEVAAALEKLFRDDTEMQQLEHNSSILWHRVSEDVIEPFSGPSGVPGLVSPSTKTSKSTEEEEKAPDPVFPDGAVTVAKGCLFVGTNFEYLTEILDRLEEGLTLETISGDETYKEVDRIFFNMGMTDRPHFLQFFAKTDETMRPTYEMVQNGTMPQSQAI
ncbi:MAG: hypothetical protein ACRCUY_00650, partial [Thermoguttaceae bacterium]